LVDSKGLGMKKITADSFSPHPRSDRVRRRQQPGVVAWIIQWVDVEIADGIRPLEKATTDPRRVVAVLSPRVPSDRVYEIAMGIYMAQQMTPSAMLAIRRMRRNSVLAARYATAAMRIGKEIMRGPVHDVFAIGRDPCLCARRVGHLREGNRGKLVWLENRPGTLFPRR
jgi:hypothetical protein